MTTLASTFEKFLPLINRPGFAGDFGPDGLGCGAGAGDFGADGFGAGGLGAGGFGSVGFGVEGLGFGVGLLPDDEGLDVEELGREEPELLPRLLPPDRWATFAPPRERLAL